MRAQIKLLVLTTITTIVLTAQPKLKAQEIIVPAGTILECTLMEPNLSSKTAEMGEPILCSAGLLREFGMTVFPRGAYLGGRFGEYRDPGHFWGKGWMQLDFNRLLLPDAVIPISAKVTSAPRLKVDAQGRIHGRGHARRDAVEWMFPPLWPVKVLTLPMRGPRPALKGESRLSLKLMQDVSVPEAAVAPSRSLLKPGLLRPSPERVGPKPLRAASTASEPAAEQSIAYGHGPLQATAVPPESSEDANSKQLTFLILKDGKGQLVTDYWFEAGRRLQYLTADGTSGLLPIGVLDYARTVKLNRERGVEFVIRSKNTEDERRAPEGDDYIP
jgi:hypothetical protein